MIIIPLQRKTFLVKYPQPIMILVSQSSLFLSCYKHVVKNLQNRWEKKLRQFIEATQFVDAAGIVARQRHCTSH